MLSLISPRVCTLVLSYYHKQPTEHSKTPRTQENTQNTAKHRTQQNTQNTGEHTEHSKTQRTHRTHITQQNTENTQNTAKHPEHSKTPRTQGNTQNTAKHTEHRNAARLFHFAFATSCPAQRGKADVQSGLPADAASLRETGSVDRYTPRGPVSHRIV